MTGSSQSGEGSRLCKLYRRLTCKYCGCTTDGTNHRSTSECIEALEREVERLRRLVAQQQPKKPEQKVLSWNRRVS